LHSTDIDAELQIRQETYARLSIKALRVLLVGSNMSWRFSAVKKVHSDFFYTKQAPSSCTSSFTNRTLFWSIKI